MDKAMKGVKEVSIRSLHRSTGRCVSNSLYSNDLMFQSAPCTEVQGDAGGCTARSAIAGSFNPLPAPKYREMEQKPMVKTFDYCFNPLPAPKYREISMFGLQRY